LTYNSYDVSVLSPSLLGDGRDMIDEARYCLNEAARCYRLARGRFDENLLEIGDEFASRALILGADPLHLPERWHGGIGAIEV
jgi:hypothetical protein